MDLASLYTSDEVVRQFGVEVLEEDDGSITVVGESVLDARRVRELSFLLGKQVVQRNIDVQAKEMSLTEERGDGVVQVGVMEMRKDKPAHFKQHVGEGTVVQQVDRTIGEAIRIGASDIHIEPYEALFRVRYRIDGALHEIGQFALRQRDAITSRIKIMAGLDIAEKRRPQDGRIRFDHNGTAIDLRVSTLPTDFGEKIVLRILDKRNVNLQLDALGFSAEQLEAFNRAIHLPFGMILVTGPTGSGKTTTLYAALNALNTPEVNITTIEDPIEYNLVGINQTHVRSDIGLTFAHALRAFLRQDPNIIMVGEMRDAETVDIAIRAALTGHMVLSTLHTNDAPSTLTRLSDMGAESFLVASSVRLVIAQRLVRRICSACKTSVSLDAGLCRQLGIESSDAFEGAGCATCHGTGYKGRIALFELMPVTEALAELIAKGGHTYELRRQAAEDGMVSLRDTGLAAVRNGHTTAEEVLRETVM